MNSFDPRDRARRGCSPPQDESRRNPRGFPAKCGSGLCAAMFPLTVALSKLRRTTIHVPLPIIRFIRGVHPKGRTFQTAYLQNPGGLKTAAGSVTAVSRITFWRSSSFAPGYGGEARPLLRKQHMTKAQFFC